MRAPTLNLNEWLFGFVNVFKALIFTVVARQLHYYHAMKLVFFFKKNYTYGSWVR